MRLIFWLVAAVIAAFCVDFAYWNRATVEVAFWPFVSLDMALYLVVLPALLLGFLFGELVAWIHGRHWRRAARARARRIEALERELGATQALQKPEDR